MKYFNPNFSRNKYDGKKIDNFNTNYYFTYKVFY